ncbi:HVA1 family protein [Maribacter cobaltidurans]|uniref:HVA1 family protein n=1 Tax=Maribacter cobaltidurans TaxID=1178778 RepID=UPI002686CD75|nr:HVA1 family protein [Maribacter cobaltidurans]
MIREGTVVKWKWGSGYAKGKVMESFDHKITKEIKGAKVIRNGTTDDKHSLLNKTMVTTF